MTADGLPEELEERLYEIHFDAPAAERSARIDELCRQSPTHEAAIRRRQRALERSDELLGHARSGLGEAAETQRIGPFSIRRVLGEGGFGTVYLATQQEPVRRDVALKVLLAGRVTGVARRRFEDERQLLARLQHKSIAQVYDAGVSDRGQPYFAMEFVDGQPLTEWCRENRADAETRLRLFVGVCAAIHHAHQRGVVHRDLKPTNVLVRIEDGQPLPKVIDFGIAKVLADDGDAAAAADPMRTLQGMQIGTPGYMSPEQAVGEPVDTRTDVYSLGVILCELLTGDLPVPRSRLQSASFAAISRILNEEPPRRPSAIVADTPRAERDGITAEPGLLRRLRTDLDWVVLHAVAAARDDRYTSVSALADDVERHLNGEPVLVRHNTTTYLLRKFVLRHRIAVTVASTIAIALVVAVAALSWSLREVGTARRQAENDRDLAQARDVAARMAVTQLAMQSGDVRTAIEYLDSIPEAMRGWEWRHLAAQTDNAATTLDAGVPGLEAVWVDDRRVAVFPLHGDVICWNVDTGRPEWLLDGWNDTCRRVVGDHASRTALVAGDRGVSLWNLDDGTHLRDLGAVPGEPYAIAWSDDRKVALVAGEGRWIDRIDVTGQTPTRRVRLERNATAVAFVDDERVLIGYEDGSVQCVSQADERTLASMNAHGDVVEALLAAPQQDLAWSASIDGSVRAWRLSTGEAISRTSCAGRMRRLARSPDGELLFAAGGYNSAILGAWSATSLELAAHYHGHSSGVGTVVLSPDGTRLASVGRDGTLRTWSAEPPRDCVRLFAGRDARVLTSSPDGTRFATASFEDGRVTIWDAHTLEPQLALTNQGYCTGVHLLDDVVLVASDTIRALDPTSGAELARGPTNRRQIGQMAVDAERRFLIGGYGERSVIWDLPDLAVRHDVQTEAGSGCFAWDPHVGAFAIGAAGRVVWVDPERGDVVRAVTLTTPRHLHANSIGSVTGFAVTPDALLVASSRGLHAITADGDRSLLGAACTALAISPDGTRFATAGQQNEVRVRAATSCNQLLVLGGMSYGIRHVAFVDGGRRLLALPHRWESQTFVHVWTAPDEIDFGR